MDIKKELETNKEDFLSFLVGTAEHKKVIAKEDGAIKENFMPLAGGKTEHKRVITKEDGAYIQFDYLTTRISLNTLTDDSVNLFNYWCIEDFDRAYINWGKNEIVLIYSAKHYVPETHAMEMLKDPTTLTTLEED